jgi:hypothetical protein
MHDVPLTINYFQQRDEVVGVYGFIFFRDHAWVSIIIDEYVLPASTLKLRFSNRPFH